MCAIGKDFAGRVILANDDARDRVLDASPDGEIPWSAESGQTLSWLLADDQAWRRRTMFAYLRQILSAVVILGTAAAVQAADPATGPEPLPLPRRAWSAGPEGRPEWHARPEYTRQNPYDVWLYYGVDRQGKFRPRVVYSPYGPYYLYNGEPYLYAPPILSISCPTSWTRRIDEKTPANGRGPVG